MWYDAHTMQKNAQQFIRIYSINFIQADGLINLRLRSY